MSVKERLILFAESQRISHSEFCRKIGVSNAFISSMRRSLQPDKIERIALNYPQLNISWLITGEGQMLKQEQGTLIHNVGTSNNAVSGSGKISVSTQEQSKEVEYLKSIIKEKDD